MAQNFIAFIEGRADLAKAKREFADFKTQVEQPIKLTFDTNGLNAIFTGLGKQAQQVGAQIGQTLSRSINTNVKLDSDNIRINPKTSFSPRNIGGELNMDIKLAGDLIKQLDTISKKGGTLQKITLAPNGDAFTAIIRNGEALIDVFGRLEKSEDDAGNVTKEWATQASRYTVDYTNAVKQAQKESQTLADKVREIGDAFSTGTFDKEISKMESAFANIGKDVSSNDIKKMSDAASEYYRITQQIQDSLSGKSANPLQGQDLADAYDKAQLALQSFNNAFAQMQANAKSFGIETGNAVKQSIREAETAAKKAQQEADKLAQGAERVTRAYKADEFIKNTDMMAKQLSEVSNTVPDTLVQKAQRVAAEYKHITDEIIASQTGKNPLTDAQTIARYDEAKEALRRYKNVMDEVKYATQDMFDAGANVRAANKIDEWAKKNSRALGKYGEKLDEIKQKMLALNPTDKGGLRDLTNEFKNVESEASALGLTGLSLGDQIKNSFSKIAQFTGIYAFTSKVRQAIMQIPKEVVKIDTAMTELRKVSTASANEISNYFDTAADSAYKYGQAIDEVINATASWTRLGYNLKDASILTDVTAELAQVGSGLDTKSATEGLQATIRGFGLMAEDAKYVGDLINEVADTQPIDAIGIINGLERSSAVMKETNNTLEEAVGLITATTSVTQDASSAGTAWRTVALRITGAKQELEQAGLETEGMVESTAKLRDNIKAVAGIDILESDGKTFKSTYQIMSELAKVWDHLSDLDKAGLLDKIAGKRGAVAVSAALQNWNIAEGARDTALTAEGSMDRQLEIYNQSVQASLDKLRTQFQEFSKDFLNSDLIRGIIDAGTLILKILDELIKHIGSLGTVITTLGLTRIVTTMYAGAKGASNLTTATVALLNALKGGVGGVGAFNTLLGEMTGAATGATTALAGILKTIGGIATAHPVGLIVGATIAAAGIAYKAYKKQQEELIKQASETSQNWQENKSSIDEYKEKYTELNNKLNEANLAESERIGIKRQLIDLQNEIIQKYGTQASGIDLVNGKLETQLSILSNISDEEARRNIRDNREAYELSKTEMTKSRKYTIGNNGLQYLSQSGLQSQLLDIFKNAKFEKTTFGFKFVGDAKSFKDASEQVLDELDKLKNEAIISSDRDILQGLTDSVEKAYRKNEEVLKTHQDNYKSYLEQSLFAEGYGDELTHAAQLVQEFNDALLSDDTDTALKKRAEIFDYYENTVKNILKGHDEYGVFFNEIREQVESTSQKMLDWKEIVEKEVPDASNTFIKSYDVIKKGLDKLKSLEFSDIDINAILGNPENVNYDWLNELAQLWDKDFDFNTDGSSFIDFLEQLGVISVDTADGVDLAKSSFEDFLKMASSSIEAVDKVNAALVNSFKEGGLSAKINQETGALEGNVADILNAYKGADVSDIFERTANGIIVNRDELRALEAEQEKMLKQQFGERIEQAYASWQSAIATGNESGAQYWKEQYDNVRLLASAYDGATNAYKKWVDAQKMGEAGDQYDAVATTALKRGKELYDAGLVGTNEFRAIAQLYSNLDLSTASIDEITEAYENGVNTVKKYFTEGQEGAVAFADKLVELEYATKDADGNYDFLDGIDTQALADDLGISVELVEAAMQKLGDYGFDIHFQTDDVNLDNVRKELIAWSEGGNVDLTLRPVVDTDLLSAAGWDIEEDAKGLATVFTSTFSNEAGDVAINFTPIMVDENGNSAGVLSPSELQDYAMGVINGVHDDYLHLQIGAKFEGEDAIQQASDVAEQIHEDHDELVMNGTFKWDESELHYAETSLDHFYGRLAYFDKLKEIKPEVEVDIHNDEQLRNLATDLLEMNEEDVKPVIDLQGADDVDEVIDKLKEQYDLKVNVEADQSSVPTDMNSTVHADVDVDSSGVKIADQTVHVEPEPNPLTVKMVAELDHTVVDNYESSLKPIPRTQVFDTEHSKVDSYINSLHDIPRSVNYTVDVFDEWKVNDLPKTQDRYITYHIDTVGAKPFYKGTVSKSSFNGMSHVAGTAHANGIGLKQDENALINELGAEIVVRPSEDSWMIFNDGKPTFASLKKDDVKIYCVHVQRCA